MHNTFKWCSCFNNDQLIIIEMGTAVSLCVLSRKEYAMPLSTGLDASPYGRVLEQIGEEPSTPLDVFALPESDRPTSTAQTAPVSAVVAEAA